MRSCYIAISSILLGLFMATGSAAQNGRSFVSGQGLDTNPCTLAAPCRTFAQAILSTSDQGEVIAIDSAGYGGFTVNRNIVIAAADGVYASISPPGAATGQFAITVSGADVTLRNLAIAGAYGENNGINATGGNLIIENCKFTNLGSAVVMSTQNTNPFILSTLAVVNSDFRYNGDGVDVAGIGVSATVLKCRFENNGISNVLAESGTKVTVKDTSVVSAKSLAIIADW